MMKIYEIFNLGTTALGLVSALMSKDSHMFAMSLVALISGGAQLAKIKELDPLFLQSLQSDVDSLATKIFAHIG